MATSQLKMTTFAALLFLASAQILPASSFASAAPEVTFTADSSDSNVDRSWFSPFNVILTGGIIAGYVAAYRKFPMVQKVTHGALSGLGYAVSGIYAFGKIGVQRFLNLN